MNCNQARTMMSAYRELKNEEIDTSELDAHLEECAACREVLANYTRVGEQVHAAPVFSPPPDMHAKLMKALADEQLKLLQKSAPGKVPTPEFLKPYLQERAEATHKQDDIAAFSTAETGPLPMIRARRKKARRIPVNQFAILGLAAAILIMLMTGGLTSLLMLAKNNPTTISKTTSSLTLPTEIEQKAYTTTTDYPNITSVLASDNYLYYTASGNGMNSNTWMVMQFDRNTRISKPLLETPSNNSLILLQVSKSWLIWLEYSRPQALPHQVLPGNDGHHLPLRDWSLHVLSLLPSAQNANNDSDGNPSTQSTVTPTVTPTPAGTPTGKASSTQKTNPSDVDLLPDSVVLAQGTFDSQTSLSWINSPIQGSWLVNDNTFLMTFVDQKGVSHLESFDLSQPGVQSETGNVTETGNVIKGQILTSAPTGHVLLWPTADALGMHIYWADEWLASDGTLHSNIWQQETSEQSIHSHGFIGDKTTSTQKVLLGDGLSFHPQVVDNTLFFLSTSEVSVINDTIVPNGIPLPVDTNQPVIDVTPSIDPNIYSATPDASVHGTIFLLPLDGANVGVESTLGTVGQAAGLHAGSNFVVWQESSGYKMYDATRQADVVLGNTLSNAALLIVDDNTTLWLAGNANSGANLTMMAYDWPN